MILLTLLIQLVWSAPHSVDEYPTSVPYNQVRRLIQLKGKEDIIKKLGPEAYKHMRDLAFSSTETVEDRYRALITIAKIGGPESVPDLDMALKNPQWFMRAAGLLGMGVAHRETGVARAKDFMHKDPALLVRAAALQVIAQQPNVDKNYLWNEVYNPMNFNNGKGLPIRVSIMRVLEKSLNADDSDKLAALSREDNKEIKEIAKSSLVKIAATGKKSKKVSALMEE